MENCVEGEQSSEREPGCDSVTSRCLRGQSNVRAEKDQNNIDNDQKPIGHTRGNLWPISAPPRLESTRKSELLENVDERS